MIKVLNFITTFLVFLSTTPVYSESGSEFNLEKLKLVMESNNTQEAVEYINLSKGKQYQESVRKYMLELWASRYSGLHAVLENDLVLINIADFISQSNANSFANAEMGSVLELARNKVNAENRRIVSRALAILSRSPDDIDIVFDMVKNAKSEYLFNVSVLSVLANCDMADNDKLKSLEGLSDKKKQYIKDSLIDFDAAGLCQSADNAKPSL